ncbi:MAG TPA: phosphotransferase [Thermomicrobiales bacterium]|nr:phosphotransferase [Thermomicrobiales bacterium]
MTDPEGCQPGVGSAGAGVARDDPGLDLDTITACLNAEYGLRVSAIEFLPLGYDLSAAVYKVIAEDGRAYFLKIRFGQVREAGLLVPWALSNRGIRNVLAPLQTRSSALWGSCDGRSLILYPFIAGENAMAAGMTDEQWRDFGSTLQAVHSSGLAKEFRARLPVETFALPSGALVRRVLDLTDTMEFENAVAARFAAFWRENAARIRQILARAEELGRRLQSKAFDHVLCHADIHAANILVGDDGQIHLIDWDGPLIAPRERDLLFVVGSVIARRVEPREEELFFAGYGPVEIDPEALVYYRYERIVEDFGEIGRSVLLDPSPSDQMRVQESQLAQSFFAPGGDIDHAEAVTLPNR